jgi:LAO/AO transport system kinase
LSVDTLAGGVIGGDRSLLARAITLVESSNMRHQKLAGELLGKLLPHSGKAHRIGITGVPGVGKSTTIDQLGANLIAEGHRVAVLAVDPSSTRTGGSILGDKTRMARLAFSPDAFVRPSPTSGTLGGVTRKTREIMIVLEAGGFDIIIIETVGVGQSEVAVSEMVDFFLVMLLAGGGDELQGIKKGIIEIADMIVINKADGDNLARAKRSAADYRAALNMLAPATATWRPPVLTASGRDNTGLDALWKAIVDHRAATTASGEWAERRQRQAVSWMRDMLAARLMDLVRTNAEAAAELAALEEDVRAGRIMPTAAVDRIMANLERR